MNDPFFDEDDGEFDDLYENSRPSTSSLAVRPKERKNDVPVAFPINPRVAPSMRSPAVSSSIDDTPRFFEATNAERAAQRKKDKEQQKQLARDTAWVNSSTLPPTVATHRVSSDSYSIVERPSHTSNSPVQNQRVDSIGANATESTRRSKGRFTRALKRFFGVGSKSKEKDTLPPNTTKPPSPEPSIPPEEISTEANLVNVPEDLKQDSGMLIESASNGLQRHSAGSYYGTSGQNVAPQESFRSTMRTYTDPNEVRNRLEATQADDTRQRMGQTQEKAELKRRGTFDDLFESPKTDKANDSAGANGWTVRDGENLNVERVSYGISAVGVARFDQRRSMDEADEFTLDDASKPNQLSTRLSNHSTEAWSRSAAMSLLGDRKEETQSEGSAFTWSNVRSSPGVGTATYAVPTSLQQNAVYEDDRSFLALHDTPSAPLGNIMDDLKRNTSLKKSPVKESVDDFFAEFEEPNDYVFDPATGGYVAARAPVRAAVSRPLTRQVSAERHSPRTGSEKAVPRDSERDDYAPSETKGRVTSVIEKEDAEVDDQVADIIVDKISSLEGELAALKQLIRTRKGGNNSRGVRERQVTSARPRVRKESIFDNDSSDEDGTKPSDPYASSIQPAAKRAGKRRLGSKKKVIKKRKDSFADLFEDSPNETETFGGASSYEALFQTGDKATESNKDEDSDEEVDLTSKPIRKSTTKARRRSSRKKIGPVMSKEDSSEPEVVSLKGRRAKRPLRRKNDDELEEAGIFDSTDQVVTKPVVDVVPVSKSLQMHAEEEDPIDALFDISTDHDVAKLYGDEDAHDRDEKNGVMESQPGLVMNGNSALRTESDASGATNVQPVEPAGVNSPDSLGIVDADEEEEFSINWTKMRKTKSQRHKSRRNPSVSTVSDAESISADRSAENILLDSSLVGKGPKPTPSTTSTTVVSDQVTGPQTVLADASSNWMSVSTLENETLNLSITGDMDLHPVGDNESLEPSTDEKKSDEENAAQSPLATPELAERTSADDNLSERDDADEDPAVNLHSASTKADYPIESVANFDIFDKSSDVNFLSATSSTNLKAPNHDDDSDGDERISLPDDEETISFEIKVPKKRVSVLNAAATTNSEPERLASSPPSPTSSVDEIVEFGKYATSSVPSSMDGSVDDLEDPPLGDEEVLGKVESQAFDSDWHQMQAKEKERKKRLQAKQRQAQRDKVLRKQGPSSRSYTGSSSAQSLSKSKSKNSKKKRKDKDDTVSSSQHKKNGSRKHRHRDGSGDSTTASQPSRSLTEL